jgi:hypothetical protein
MKADRKTRDRIKKDAEADLEVSPSSPSPPLVY